MKYQGEIKEDIIFLTIEGDLIGESNGAEIVGYISDKMSGTVKNAGINLSSVRYMNSSGIGVLITLLTKLKNVGGGLCLIDPSEQIMKLLQITKLNDVFTIVNNEAEAIQKLK